MAIFSLAFKSLWNRKTDLFLSPYSLLLSALPYY